MNIQHEKDQRRFAAELEHGTAELAYSEHPEGVLDLQHTFVPPEARGGGVGESLVEAAIAFARENNYRIIPSCPFVRAWMRQHPEAEDLVATR